MKNAVKKVVLFGVGAVSLTRKKAEKYVSGLYKKKIIKKSDVNKLVNGIVNLAEMHARVIACNTRKAVNKIAKIVVKSTDKSWVNKPNLKSRVKSRKK